MKILAIIPARGGSKGVPKKNSKLLHGIPLLEYSIIAAQKTKFITIWTNKYINLGINLFVHLSISIY